MTCGQPSAHRPGRGVTDMARMPHIQLDESIDATAAILPGDPARVDTIAACMEDYKRISAK